MAPEAQGNIYGTRQVKGKIWNLLIAVIASLPPSLRKLQCRLSFAAAAKSGDAAGLRELFSLQDDLMRELEQTAIRYEGGIHPKHRVTGYHRFFVERIRAGEKVLDIGCGNGSVAFSMAETGAVVTGIDINESLIQSARHRYERANLSFITGDATKGLPSGCFDVVVLSNVLEHIDDRQQFLMNVCEKARPKRLLIRVPMINRNWVVPLRKELGMSYLSDPTHSLEYTRDGLEAELRDAGLIVESVETVWGEFWIQARTCQE
jgi:2-polyprenyl-3-methyl-5-hydroxy-6-metoxy-1,4-benzoquinol methylase